MNYSNIYYKIISYRKNNPYHGYTEKHHILPKCMGGTDIADNLVSLSAREHYLCHLLLTRMFTDSGLIRAAVLMGAQTGATSRTYSKVREKFSAIQSISQTGTGNSQYGTKWVYSIDLKLSKKIAVSEEVPKGFFLGRVINFDKFLSPTVTELKKQKNVLLYTELYRIYNELGWDQFIKQTGYTKSKPNFVQMCSRHVEEYLPQNGKRRGK